MAVKIQDSLPITIQLGGRDWQAGYIIHQFRMNLMRQHVGEKNPSSGIVLILLLFIYYR